MKQLSVSNKSVEVSEAHQGSQSRSQQHAAASPTSGRPQAVRAEAGGGETIGAWKASEAAVAVAVAAALKKKAAADVAMDEDAPTSPRPSRVDKRTVAAGDGTPMKTSRTEKDPLSESC